jgi:outer membrane lipoprotein SlyB
MRRLINTGVSTLCLLMAASAFAQKPAVYPAKGQSADKQAKDDAACYSWAKQSSGVDPAQVASTAPTQTGPSGERARGAARGALGGAVIGGIAGDAGKGAAAGAAAGTLAGGHRTRQKQNAQNQQAQGQQQAMNDYYRAYGACMTGKGYTVH